MSTPKPKKQYWREYPNQRAWVLFLPHKYNKYPIIVLETPRNTDRDWATELYNSRNIIVQHHTDDYWLAPPYKQSLIFLH